MAMEFRVADVTDDEGITAIIDEFAKKRGLDAVVNNAAIQRVGPTLEASLETWQEVVGVNVWGASVVIRAGLPWLTDGGGAVVNVASVHALATSAEIGVYAASKGALVALTRALAIELAPKGVRVNAILPGAVDTGMLRDGLTRSAREVSEAMESLARRTVIGRVGTPEEIGHAIEFLADEVRSSFITGSCLVVDGGATSRLSTE